MNSAEQLLAVEEMVGQLESLLNSFADATARIKQRMVTSGFSEASAEAFAVSTAGTLTTGLMSQFSTPVQQELQEIKTPGFTRWDLLRVGVIVAVVIDLAVHFA